MNININRALRIASVLLAQMVLVYGHFRDHGVVTVAIFIVLLLAFLVLSSIHSSLTKQDKIAKAKLELDQRNAARKSGKWIEFSENGSEYIDEDHPYSKDLNLFGKASLFQYLNEANTKWGKDILKLLFLTDKRDQTTLARRQEAIKEISANQGFCESLNITGMLSKSISKDPTEMVDFFESNQSLFTKPTISLTVRSLPIGIILLIIINFVAGYNNALVILTGVAIIVQVMVFASLSNRTEATLKELSKFGDSLDDFGTMVELIRETKFLAEANKIWQDKLPSKWNLKKITWALKVRNITLVDLLLNILFLWDIHCVSILEKMRQKGAKDMGIWLETIGYFETMVSVAILPRLNPDWVYPDFNEKYTSIKAKNLAHPLINEFDRVANDFELTGVAIISGSNMSGKTTFLRTLGINLVLGYMGSPVCATKFRAPILDLWTCMNPADNLNQNISTFYAELLRIKKIIDNEKPMLFLIDEIFGGTNSEDRIEGAKQILLNLSKKQNLGLVTTHDHEVCKTEGLDNYHFSEKYVNGDIFFDYKIKAGISTTRNAKHLMKIVGIDVFRG